MRTGMMARLESYPTNTGGVMAIGGCFSRETTWQAPRWGRVEEEAIRRTCLSPQWVERTDSCKVYGEVKCSGFEKSRQSAFLSLSRTVFTLVWFLCYANLCDGQSQDQQKAAGAPWFK